MDALFADCLNRMDRWFRRLETAVPRPVQIPYLRHFVFRYAEKTLEQALVMKLARVVTGLHSARILLDHGFLQEQAAVHRMLDEFQQDITFLSMARLDHDFTELHERYLSYFYEEEFDKPQDPVASTQKRPSIPRQKIHAYLARKEADIGISDPSRGKELTRTLSKAYSGFVHGASTQILNMYGGNSARFQISGMRGTPHELDHRRDLWNYFYRGILSFNEIALVLNDSEVATDTHAYAVSFEQAGGKNYSQRAQTET
jgi:hypothetical protein